MFTQNIYLVSGIIFCTGLYIILSSKHYFRKIIGLAVLQNSVIVFFLSLGKVVDGSIPILNTSNLQYTSPVPQVLMLTAIVVGFTTISVAVAMIVKIIQLYGTSNEDTIKYGKSRD